MEATNSNPNLNESEKNNEGEFITMVDVLKEEQGKFRKKRFINLRTFSGI